MLHATPPDYSRIFCRLLRRYLLVFFCVFDKRQRALSDRKKSFCETPAVQRSCYLFWWIFEELAGSTTFVTIIFATNFMIFFDGGVGGVNFLFFLLHNDYLKPVFFYLAQRGERRFVVDIGSLSSSPTAWLKNKKNKSWNLYVHKVDAVIWHVFQADCWKSYLKIFQQIFTDCFFLNIIMID